MFQATQEAFVMQFNYALENTTNRDYTLPSDVEVTERMSDDVAHANYLHPEIEGNVFIPAHHTTMVRIKIPYKYDDYNTTFEKEVDEKKSQTFASRRLNRLGDFMLFDKENNYEMLLPNQWSDSEDVKNAFKATDAAPQH